MVYRAVCVAGSAGLVDGARVPAGSSVPPEGHRQAVRQVPLLPRHEVVGHPLPEQLHGVGEHLVLPPGLGEGDEAPPEAGVQPDELGLVPKEPWHCVHEGDWILDPRHHLAGDPLPYVPDKMLKRAKLAMFLLGFGTYREYGILPPGSGDDVEAPGLP